MSRNRLRGVYDMPKCPKCGKEEEYPKEVAFVIKSEDDESDLFELLYKHNIKFKPVEQEPDTYELEMDEMVAP
jgi:hypothetical protein